MCEQQAKSNSTCAVPQGTLVSSAWPELSAKIGTLQPGEKILFRVPRSVRISYMRQLVEIHGQRAFKGSRWRVATKSDGRVVTAYLIES